MATTDSQQATQTSTASEGSITGNDTFSAGATLTSQLNFISDGMNFYYWTGAFDKVVPAGSTPDDTGGVGDGAWKVAGDAAIRENLGSHELPGADLVSLHIGTVYNAIYYYTPEMFGAVGDGSHDDFDAIQRMLDNTPDGAVFVFNPEKTYYNAFANEGNWLELTSRKMWQRSKSATFIFNGAIVTRRQPKWADNNAKNNNNTGVYYTDQDTALFRFTGGDTVIHMDKPNLDGANPIGAIKNTSGNDTSATGYAQCECRDYGVYADSIAGITITGARIKNCCFNIYLNNCTNITIDGYIYQSGQAWKMISSDLALGAGIKLLNCTNFKIDVYGYRNTNATVEVEPNNNFGIVNVISQYDYSNTLVIYDSGYITVDGIARNVVNGSGLQIIQGGNGGQTKNIKGSFIVDGCSWKGMDLRMTSAAAFDIIDIDLKLKATACALTAYHADQTEAVSTGFIMRDIYVNVIAYDNASGTAGGYAVRISGDVRGETSGKVRNAYIGFLCDGGNNATYGHRRRMDLTENITNTYSVSSTNYVDWFGTITASEIRLMSLAPKITMSRANNLGGERDYSEIWIRTPVLRFANLPIDPASTVTYQFYTHQTTESGVNVYTGHVRY